MAEVNVKVGMNNSAFSKGLDSMKKQAQGWAASVGKIFVGAFAFQKVVSIFANLATELDRVGKLATRLGESVEDIQRIGHAAKLAGTDIEEVVKVMTRLTLEAAKSGAKLEAAGISVEAFMGASSKGKVLLFAKAFDEANGDAAKHLAIMEALGARGQNLLPMIAQGYEAVSKQMGETAVHSEKIVRGVEFFNDTLATLAQKGKVALMEIVKALVAVGAVAVSVQKQIRSALVFDFKGVKTEILSLNKFLRDLYDTTEKPMTGTGGLLDPDAIREAADELSKFQKAYEDIQKRLADRALDRMDTEGQILKLQEAQIEAMERMEDLSLSALDRANAAKESLDLQEKIEAAEKRAAQEAEESAAEIARLEQEQAKAQQAVADAEAKVAAEEDRQAFEKLTPQEKLESLQGKQAELFKKSEQARDEGDPLAAAEARLDALKMNDEIDAAKQAVKDEEEDEEEDEDEKMAMPAQVSSSLGAVGGGGGTFVGFDLELAEAKAQTRLLEKIAANTASGQGVTKTNGEFF
jgi:hypothetical protein